MKICVTAVLIALTANVVTAENWPHWRGPFFNGSSSDTGLPTEWSRTENIRWSADLPGPGAGTPVIWDDHVYLTSTVPSSNALVAMCLDRNTGNTLWRHEIDATSRKDERSTFAAPSPVTDGTLVVFFFGNGETLACNLDGKKLWTRNIQKDFGEFAFQWTFSSTPLLYNGTLYFQVLQRDVPVRGRGSREDGILSFILAVDPTTGKDSWRQQRLSNAVAESREAFSSPIPFTHAGRTELLIAGGDAISGHDIQNGKELWRWGTWNPQRIGHWRLVPSPVASDDVILACAPKRSPIYAVKAGGAGELTDDALAWVSRSQRDISSDVPTPAFYDGDFFILSDVRKCLSRVEPKTGIVKWTIPTPDRLKYEASPTVADGKIYLINFGGLVVVVDAEKGKVLNEVPMAEPAESYIRSTIAVSNGNLFIRTNQKLYCVGSSSGGT